MREHAWRKVVPLRVGAWLGTVFAGILQSDAPSGGYNDNNDTAAKASIGEVSRCADRVDAQVREVLGQVLAQRRSAGTALACVAGLAPG